LPPTGEGTVYLGYQHLYVRNHVDSKGVEFDAGHIHSRGLIMDVDYGLGEDFRSTCGTTWYLPSGIPQAGLSNKL